VKLYVPEERY